jgi:hypothetical protein
MQAMNALRNHSGFQLQSRFLRAFGSGVISLLMLAGCATSSSKHQAAVSGPTTKTKVVEAFTWHPTNLGRNAGYAAELIEKQLSSHLELTSSERAISHLRAAVLFALAEQTSEAVAELDQARVTDDQTDLPVDWNDMLVSGKAFLLKDRAQLVAARERIAALPSPTYLRYPDSLLQHFGQSYSSLPTK